MERIDRLAEAIERVRTGHTTCATCQDAAERRARRGLERSAAGEPL